MAAKKVASWGSVVVWKSSVMILIKWVEAKGLKLVLEAVLL